MSGFDSSADMIAAARKRLPGLQFEVLDLENWIELARAGSPPDGSIDVAIQHDPPAGDQTNWLPAPAGPFVVTLRMYWPQPAAVDGTYRIPAIERS